MNKQINIYKYQYNFFNFFYIVNNLFYFHIHAVAYNFKQYDNIYIFNEIIF